MKDLIQKQNGQGNVALRENTVNLPDYHPFKSAAAREEYLQWYGEAESKWPVPSETRMVETAYGQTLVRVSGPEGAPALVLLAGGGFNSLSWLPHVEALSRDYRTYAVDSICDNGRSVYTRDIAGFADLVSWLDELFSTLGLDKNVNLMGLSMGGQIAAEYTLLHPEQISKIVMIAPAAVVQPVSPAFNLRIMLCLLPGRYFLDSFYSWLFQDLIRQGEAGRKLAAAQVEESRLGVRCFKARRIIQPRVFSDAELQSIKVSALYLVGENEKICSAMKAAGRLGKVAPQIKAEIIPDAGHDLAFTQKDLVLGKILEFLTQE